MKQKLPLKLLLVLAINPEGLTYKELEQKTAEKESEKIKKAGE